MKKLVQILSICAFLAGIIAAFLFRIAPDQNEFGLRVKRGSESLPVYMQEQMQRCQQSSKLDRCLASLSDILLNQFSMREVLELVRETQSSPEVFPFCHEVTHFLGQELYRREGTAKAAYSQCFEVCGAGCHHGVLEGYLKERRINARTDDETLITELASFCGIPEDHEMPLLYNECIHGIGHGLMFLTNLDLTRSLALCDRLAEPQLCYNGVFMENSFWIGGLDASGNWRPPRSVDLTNPRAPCDTLPIRYQRDCYGQQAANFGSATDWNLPEFVEMCRHIPEEFQDQCYVYIGAQQTLMIKDVSAMKEACDIAPIDRYENLCIEALATTLGGRYVGDPSWILSLCALADPNTKETCYRQLAGYLDNWGMNADEYQEVCRKILEQEYAPWCHTGE